MSKVTKRKHVMNEAMWNEFELPKENQSIVKVLKSRGNNLHEVITADGEEYLVSMPTKFRKNIWIKRGDYILVEPIKEGDKIKAEIVKIMNKAAIKYYKENNVWPKGFTDAEILENTVTDNKELDNGDVFVQTNRNRIPLHTGSNSSSSDTDSSDADSSASLDSQTKVDTGNETDSEYSSSSCSDKEDCRKDKK